MARQHYTDNYDRYRLCTHTPGQTYTREPCSCGRELWPPRGRGRGESLYSPRRIEAKLKACDAYALHIMGTSYAAIATQLGYRTPSGAWRAVQRIRAQESAWYRYEAAGGTVGTRWRHQPTDEQLQQTLTVLEEELSNDATLGSERLEQARERLRRLLIKIAH